MDLFVENAKPREIQFVVPGEVRGKKAPLSRIVRPNKPGAKEFVSTYTDATTRNNEAKIGSYAMEAKGKARWDMTVGVPLAIAIMIHLHMPASWSKKKRALWLNKPAPCKPDGSNVLKSVEDACQDILFADDKAICHSVVKKIYVDDSAPEGMIITVRVM